MLNNNFKNIFGSVVLAGLLVGCGNNTTSSDPVVDNTGGAGGAPAKGPFKEGSSVTAQKVTIDNTGAVSYGVTADTDLVTLNRTYKYVC